MRKSTLLCYNYVDKLFKVDETIPKGLMIQSGSAKLFIFES